MGLMSAGSAGPGPGTGRGQSFQHAADKRKKE